MVQIFSSFITVSIAVIASLNLVQAAPKRCVVQKSHSDDALTIAQAFKDCQNGGTVVFPKGSSFYPKTLMDIRDLKNVNVQFAGNIVLPNYDTKFNGKSAYLEMRGENIYFEGSGTFVGSGQQWWDAGNNQGPIVFRITAKNSIFRGFRITDAPNGHFALTGCDNVVIEKVYLHSVSKTLNFARNADAWGCAWSNNLILRDSEITNGDDCAAINGGVSNITISNVKCRGGHGFSVIGALATDGRASPGRPGTVDGVRFQNVVLKNADNPIVMTSHYFCDEYHTSACYKNDGTALKFKNVIIDNITGSTSWKDLPIININCAPNTPCENVKITNVNIQKNSSTKKNVCKNLLASANMPYCKV